MICAEALRNEGVELIELSPGQRAAFQEATRETVSSMRDRFDADLIDMFEADLAAVRR